MDKGQDMTETSAEQPLDQIDSLRARLLVPYIIGAIATFENGVASAEEIDQAVGLGEQGLGPLRMADQMGLDVVFDLARGLYLQTKDRRFRPPALLRRMVQDGHLGEKCGLGFYVYSLRPAVENPSLRGLKNGEEQHRVA